MKKNLIVVRAGEKSLHPNWLVNAEPNFDLVVTFYGDAIPSEWAMQSYEIISLKGSKWRGLHRYFSTTNAWRKYERILLPDDDLLFDAKTINYFFTIAEKYSSDLSAPALDEKSFFSHPITLERKSFEARITNFVEVMCPCLSARFLDLTLPLFDESDSGWGMDHYWDQLLANNSMRPPVIVDSTTITHTRPVGSAGHGANGTSTPWNDLRRFVSKHSVLLPPPSTVAGVLKSGERLDVVRHAERLFFHLGNDLLSLSEKMGNERVTKELSIVIESIRNVDSKYGIPGFGKPK